MTERTKRFCIALSFAGENRAFVERVAARLATAVGRERVLYDAYYEAEFARPNLDIYLQRLYHDESELIAIFLSADYERKEWCGLEWRAIRDLIKKRKSETVMPLRFDHTEIEGLFSGDGYVSIRDRDPEVIADLILRRLGLTTPPATPAASPTSAPRPVAPSRPKSAALVEWERKLAFLHAEEPSTVDPDAKFRLARLIGEARAKVREHGGEA